MTTSFDQRNVRYESIHDVRPEHWELFLDACAPEDGDLVLDCGCGYGACTRELIQRHPDMSFVVDLVDESKLQFDRARTELSIPSATSSRLHFIRGKVGGEWKPLRKYDKILLKMVLHEVPRDEQVAFLDLLYDMLKPGGLLLVWDLALDPAIAEFFRSAIKTKDELLDFHTLVERRFFMTADEFAEVATRSRFGKAEMVSKFGCDFYSGRRVDGEFRGNVELYERWIAAIDGLYANLGPANRAPLRLRTYSQPDVSSTSGPVHDPDGKHRWFVVDRAIWRLRRPDVLSMIARTTNARIESHLAPSPRRDDLPATFLVAVQESLESLGRSELLRRHRGLVRVTTYEIKDRGRRELSKNGFDYVYDFREAQAAGPLPLSSLALAYFRHVALIYGAGRQPAEWRTLTDYLNHRGAAESACSWLRISFANTQDTVVAHVALSVGDSRMECDVLDMGGFAAVLNEIRRLDHDVDAALEGTSCHVRRLTLGGLSADQLATNFVGAFQGTWPTIPPQGTTARWRYGKLVDFPERALMSFAAFMVDAGLTYGCYFLPPAPLTNESRRTEAVAVFFSSDRPLTPVEESSLFAFTSKMWSDLRGIEFMSASSAFLNTAYSEEIRNNSAERAFFAGKLIFPLLFGADGATVDPKQLKVVHGEPNALETSDIFNEWADSLPRPLEKRLDLETLITYLRTTEEGITADEQSALSQVRHNLDNKVPLVQKIDNALRVAQAAGDLFGDIRDLLQSAHEDVHRYKVEDSAIAKCDRIKQIVAEVTGNSRRIIESRCRWIQKQSRMCGPNEEYYRVNLVEQEIEIGGMGNERCRVSAYRPFRFVLSDLLAAIEALRVNAQDRRSRYSFVYKEATDACVVTWLEHGRRPGWDFGTFRQALDVSLDKKGLHRGLPKVMLFALGNGVKKIELKFNSGDDDTGWQAIWGQGYQCMFPGLCSEPVTRWAVTYGIRFIFGD